MKKDSLFLYTGDIISCESRNTNYFCYYSSIRPAVDSITEISFILVYWKALILISDKGIIVGGMMITDYRSFLKIIIFNTSHSITK